MEPGLREPMVSMPVPLMERRGGSAEGAEHTLLGGKPVPGKKADCCGDSGSGAGVNIIGMPGPPAEQNILRVRLEQQSLQLEIAFTESLPRGIDDA